MENIPSTMEDGQDEEFELSVPEEDIAVPTFSSSLNEPMVTDPADQVDDEKQAIDTEAASNVEPSLEGVVNFETGEEQISENIETSEAVEKLDQKSNENDQSDGAYFNLATTDLEKSESTVAKSKDGSYVSEFHKFLQQESAKNSSMETSVKVDERSETIDVASKAQGFCPVSEDTSNSSWYKINTDEKEEKLETPSIVLPQDETSNLSMGDNGSCVSSNIGDGLSFHDQGSNLDECSNWSMPDDSSVQPYSGHQPIFDESANMNPPSVSGIARPDTPNSERDKNASESTPAKKYRRGTLQIAADDANEHGQ